jgi:O-acetyl-ADP-ribose deacetylase
LIQTIVCLTKNKRVIEFRGPADITLETTDAIVNAANSYLMSGGGVDGAIHRAGGPAILEECKRYVASHGRLPAGRAIITGGGKLAAKYVIHTVGPVYRGGGSGERELLASCHRESIRLAEGRGLGSLSFPAISTGAFGYPLREAATIAVETIINALEGANSVERVHFVLFDASALEAYTQAAVSAVRTRPHCAIERVN